MNTFTDRLGRSWSLALTAVSIKAVRKLCDVDLLALAGGEIVGVLFDDAIKLCDVCYVLCREQCDKLGISDVQFGEGMSGDCLETAAHAIIESLANFLPSAKGKTLRAVTAKARELADAALAEASAQFEAIDVGEAVRRIMGGGRSPASLPESEGESTAAVTQFAN